MNKVDFPVMGLGIHKVGVSKSQGGKGIIYRLSLNWGERGGGVELAEGTAADMRWLLDRYKIAMIGTQYDLLRDIAARLHSRLPPGSNLDAEHDDCSDAAAGAVAELETLVQT